MPNCMHDMCGIRVFILVNKSSCLCDCFVQVCLLNWHQILVGQIIDETQVLVCQSCLLFVQQFSCIFNHLHIVEVLTHFVVEQPNLNLFKLKVPFHVDLATPVAFLNTKHLLTCHFQQVAQSHLVFCFRNYKVCILSIVFKCPFLNDVNLPHSMIQALKIPACLVTKQ